MKKEEKYVMICFVIWAIISYFFYSATIVGAFGGGIGGTISTWVIYKLYKLVKKFGKNYFKNPDLVED